LFHVHDPDDSSDDNDDNNDEDNDDVDDDGSERQAYFILTYEANWLSL
jgi:hypothetical protein